MKVFALYQILILSVLTIPSENSQATETLERTETVNVYPSATVTNSGSQIIAKRNTKRIGLILYNNSSNTIYCKYGSAGNGGTDMTFPIASFSSWTMQRPIFTGAIYGIRNSGTGVVVATDLSQP